AERNDVVRTEILGHSRRFIASYEVKKQRSDSQMVELEVRCSVDEKKLRERLAALRIPVEPEHGRPGRPAIVLLVRELGMHDAVENFGENARPGPCAAAARHELETQGFQVRLAGTTL